MKFIFPFLTLLLFTSCESMEIQAEESSANSSPCAACDQCGAADSKETSKPTS